MMLHDFMATGLLVQCVCVCALWTSYEGTGRSFMQVRPSVRRPFIRFVHEGDTEGDDVGDSIVGVDAVVYLYSVLVE